MRRARAEPSKTCRAGDARGGRWPRGRRRREHCCEVRSSRQADHVRAPSIGTRGVGTRQTTVMGSPTTHACYGQVRGWLGVRAGLEKDKCATRAPLATTVVHSSSQQALDRGIVTRVSRTADTNVLEVEGTPLAVFSSQKTPTNSKLSITSKH